MTKREHTWCEESSKKSSEIDVLLYSHQNDVPVKEELAQLNDIFKLIEDINQEMIELDDKYTEELWFTDIDKKMFSFKRKVHNWLREGDEIQRIEKKSRSLCSRSTSSKSSSRSSSSKSWKLSTKERVIEEKVRLADLQAEATIKQKKRHAELQAESLRIEEEMAKALARVKIYEEENIDQKVPLKTLTMGDIKAGDSRYTIITKKQKYLDQVRLQNSRLGQGSTESQQPTISKGSYRITNTISKTNKAVLQKIKMKLQAGSQNIVRRTVRLVTCCTSWSKSSQHLV